MPLNIRPFLWIAAAVIIAFVFLGLFRSLTANQLNGDENKFSTIIKPLAFALFLILAFCAVPVFLKIFLHLAARTGIENAPMARFISTNQMKVMYGVWGIFIAGVTMALPAMIKDGFFNSESDTPSALTSGDITGTFPSALYPIRQQNKWGFMDSHFRVVIAPVFEEADDFYEGMAAVSMKKKNSDLPLFGYIDSLGKLIVNYEYEKAGRFSEGLAAVCRNGKYGYIDKTGAEVVPLVYEEASSFSEGLAAVKREGKNGFVDKQGNMVIQPQFMRSCWVSDFSEGLSAVYVGENEQGGYIDRKGNFIIAPRFDYVGKFSEGLALVKPAGNPAYGYIDHKGNFVIPPKYELSLPFTEGVASVKVQRPDGSIVFNIIDKKGNNISGDLHYAFVGIFREGLAGIETNDLRWGFIDKTGKEIIEPVYAGATPFHNGLCRVQTGSLFKGLKITYINNKGKTVWKE